MRQDFIIRTENVKKSFGGIEIIKGVDMNVRRGSVYGFLGANGAGKTTIFKLLTGLISPTEGKVEVAGVDVTKHRHEILKQIGSLIEVPTFYEHLSAEGNLEIHLAYMGVRGMGIPNALSMVGLGDTEKKPVSQFSLGMRQRLGMARAMIHQPKVMILDEPINGLDPVGIRQMRSLFLDLVHNRGMTILLSSHILSEIEHTADTVGVIAEGRVIHEIGIEQVKEKCSESKRSVEDYFYNIMSGGAVC